MTAPLLDDAPIGRADVLALADAPLRDLRRVEMSPALAAVVKRRFLTRPQVGISPFQSYIDGARVLITQSDLPRIAHRYLVGGESINALAKSYGVAYGTMWSALQRAGVERRKRGGDMRSPKAKR